MGIGAISIPGLLLRWFSPNLDAWRKSEFKLSEAGDATHSLDMQLPLSPTATVAQRQHTVHDKADGTRTQGETPEADRLGSHDKSPCQSMITAKQLNTMLALRRYVEVF